jgi:hypothetical protein
MTFGDIFMLIMLAICGVSFVVCIVCIAMAIRVGRECGELDDISETDDEVESVLKEYDRHVHEVDYHVNLLAGRMIQYETAVARKAVLDRGSYRMVVGGTAVRGQYGIGINEHRL